MKIADLGLLPAIKALLPHFVVAGRLACRIQDDIMKNGNHQQDVKSGNRFTEALTDADISVETYLGTVLLTTFDDIAFYGEEYERDRISAYFPKEAPYLVTLDPIDGTLYFKDGLPIFSSILTVCVDGAIAAALVYLPREERFYLAVKGQGAWTTTASAVEAHEEPLAYAVQERGRIVLVGSALRDRRPALEAAGFEVATPAIDYDGSKDWNKTSVAMLTGDVVGLAFPLVQLIDGGAIAFIVNEAGGKDNGPVYDMATMKAEDLVCATGPETYDKLVRALG